MTPMPFPPLTAELRAANREAGRRRRVLRRRIVADARTWGSR